MKYINSFLAVLFILIPSPTEYVYNSFPLNYINFIILIIVLFNFNNFIKTKFYVPLTFLILKIILILVFSSNSYVCFNDNNLDSAQSSKFKVSQSECKSSFNQPSKNLQLYSEKIVDINNFQTIEGNQSIQNTNWNLGFINDKKYNYFREYEQSQMWFPIEANYHIENSMLNYSKINVEYSGELIIYQDDFKVFEGSSYNFISKELISIDGSKNIQIEYKFKSFATDTTLPGYKYATLVLSDEANNLLRFVKHFETIVYIEIMLLILFVYFVVFKQSKHNFNNLTYILLIVSIFVNNAKLSLSTVFIYGVIIVYLLIPQSYFKLINDFLFSFIIASLSIFKFFPLANTIYQRGGTDGLRYESHAREIFVTNSLQAGENLFTSQPGARYILYLLKNIFGENDVLQKIVILTIIYMCILIIKNKFYSFEVNIICFFGLAYLVSSPIVLLVSESLSETFSWPFVAILFLIYTEQKNLSKSIFFLSGLIVFLRLNYVPAISLFLLLFYKKKLLNIKDIYVFISIIVLPLLHNLYYGKAFQFWVRSLDVEGNIRLESSNFITSIIKNFLIILGDFTNQIIQSYVSTRFLFLQYLLIFIFLISIFLSSRNFHLETVVLILIPAFFLAPHLFFDGITEYPKHIVTGYISIIFVSLLLNKKTNLLYTKLKLNSAKD